MNLYEQVFAQILRKEFPDRAAVPQYKWLPGRRFIADFAFVEDKILIEVDGGIFNRRAHGSVKGVLSDIKKTNLAQAHGWKIFRVAAKSGKDGMPVFINLDEVIDCIKKSMDEI